MGFLAPLYLALGAAAAVPVLLHFLRRQTGARIEFPAARYLERAEQEHSRRLRVRHLLLMLLRVAAVLLLAAAAAGPVADVVAAGHPPTALAVVLDNSLSTTAVVGGAPAFDGLRSAASAALARGSANDRLWLVTADGTVRGGTAAELASAAAAVRPLDGAGNLRAATARAAALVRATGLPASVALATDAQATAWPAPLSLGSVRLAALVPAAAPPVDHGVASARALPAGWSPGGSVQARAVASGRNPPFDSVTFRVSVGAGPAPRTAARGSVLPAAFADSNAGRLVVRASTADRGWVAGVVALAPDEFRGDDSAFFAAFVAEPPSVRAAAGPFVAAAVATLLERSQVRPADAHAVSVVAGEALASRPAVVFAPSTPVAVGAANRALERAGVPWRFGAPASGAARLVAAAGLPSLGDAQATVRYALQPAGPPGDSRVLAAAGGAPWAVAGPGYVVVASPADPGATTLPVLAPWVPWLAAAIDAAAGAGGTLVEAPPGATIAVPAGTTRLLDVAGRTVAEVRGATTPAPRTRGVYFLSRGAAAADERLGALVVNLEAEELVLDRVRDEDFARLIAANARGAGEPLVTHDADRWSAAAWSGGTRRPVAAWLLAAALVVLLAESAVARTGQRRAPLARAA